ncbi:MAG: hypothetical protein SGBAC_013512, partial [Bacillariaceae sp.]
MEQQQRITHYTRAGNSRLGAYAFPNSNDDFSMAVASVRGDASLPQSYTTKPSHPKGTTTPVICKVDSVTSSLSSSSDMGIIRPPCSKRQQRTENPAVKKSSAKVIENRNAENPVMTLQKLMSRKPRRAKTSAARMDSRDPRQQQTQSRGSFADMAVSSRTKGTTNEDKQISMPQRRELEERRKPPIYHTVIEDTRYPQPQDTLDDVFNVLEHAMCPNPAVSMKKDALDVVFGAAEKMICGPDPRYAYQRKKIGSDNDCHRPERHTLVLEDNGTIEENHGDVQSKYPRLTVAEGGQNKNSNFVLATAEATSKVRLEAHNIIPPPSVQLVPFLGLQEQPDNQDLLDVICNQVEAMTCNPRNKSAPLLAQGHHKRLVQDKDVLDMIYEGVEQEVCGASLASEEMINFGSDPEEAKRQALHRLLKPPTRKNGKPHVSTITSPAMNRTTPGVFPTVHTITPPALMRRQTRSRRAIVSSQRVQESREERTGTLHQKKCSDRRMGAKRNSSPKQERRHEDSNKRTTTRSQRDPPPSSHGNSSNETFHPPSLRSASSSREEESGVTNDEVACYYPPKKTVEQPGVDQQPGTDLANVFYWVP